MHLITDWLTIGRSGATIDGRKIEAKTLRECAKNYKKETYTAVVNIDHVRYFGNLGSVEELRIIEQDNNKVDLQARISPNLYYQKINKEGQKLFFSMELIKEFADTNEGYLVGLAATDSPASMGTSCAKFSQNEENNLQSESVEVENFVIMPKEKKSNVFSNIFKSITQKKDEEEMTEEQFKKLTDVVAEKFNEAMKSVDEKFAKIEAEQKKINEAFACLETGEKLKEALKENFAAINKNFEDLNAKFAKESTTDDRGFGASEAIDDKKEKINLI